MYTIHVCIQLTYTIKTRCLDLSTSDNNMFRKIYVLIIAHIQSSGYRTSQIISRAVNGVLRKIVVMREREEKG